MTEQDNQIVSKYLKKFGLSKAKQIVYIMRTSEDEYPKNKYVNWEDYVKVKECIKHNEFPNSYRDWKYPYWVICSQAIDEMQYQLEHYKGNNEKEKTKILVV